MPPVAAAINWELVEMDKDRLVMHTRFRGNENHLNPMGNLHGGFIAAMLDEAMGSSIFGLYDGAYLPSTINMSLSFLRPAKTETLDAHAKVVKRGRKSAHMSAELLSGESVIATSTAYYALIPSEPT